MKHNGFLLSVFIGLVLLLGASQATAQGNGPQDMQTSPGTAFTYQGQLKSAGAPVNSNCDFQFALWSAETDGAQSGTTLTKTGVAVSEGLFAVSLDFGSAAFDGNPRWLEVAVRCPTGSGNYTPLAPRQPLTPAPYALYAPQAGSVPWSGVSGAPPQLPVGCGNNQVAKWNGSTWVCSPLSFWALGGNTGTTPAANYLGTSDNQPLELRANGLRILRLEPSATAPNLLGGFSGNWITADVYGATLFGGGLVNGTGYPNRVTDHYGTVSGGVDNQAGNGAGTSDDAGYATVGGGVTNIAGANRSTVAGGTNNTAGGEWSTVGGGGLNIANGTVSAIAGGQNNAASGGYATIPGGRDNIAQGDYSFAAGQQAQANHSGAFVWADASNLPFASTGANQFDVRATGGVNLEVGSANAWVNTAPLLPRALPPTANTITIADSAGDVGEYTSVTIGADGLPVVSYLDDSNGDLKVLHCGNALCTTGNTITTVDSADLVGGSTSLSIGADGLPVVSYLDSSNGDLKVLHCGNALCTTGNTVTTVDSADLVGVYTSLSIGTDGLPVVSYCDLTNYDLKVLHCGNVLCNSGNTVTTVDSAGLVGTYTSLSIGADGLPVVSYLDDSNGDLKVLHCGNTLCNGGNTITTVDSAGDVGLTTSLSIGADGLPVVSYYDITNYDLKVLHCGNALCNIGNTVTTVDSSGLVGGYTSLSIGADGLPVVSYFDSTNADLKVLHCGNALCTSGNAASSVDSAGYVGMYTSLSIGADGLPIISYFDQTNGDLKVLHCTNPFCVPYFRRR